MFPGTSDKRTELIALTDIWWPVERFCGRNLRIMRCQSRESSAS